MRSNSNENFLFESFLIFNYLKNIMPKFKRKIRMCKELAAAKKKKKDKDSTVETFESAEESEEGEESSIALETFENVEKNTNVEEESAGDEIEEHHISLEDTEDAGNKHGEEFANVEVEDFL